MCSEEEVERHVKNLVRYMEIIKHSAIDDLYSFYGNELSEDDLAEIKSDIDAEVDKNINNIGSSMRYNRDEKYLKLDANDCKTDIEWCINNIPLLYNVKTKGLLRYQPFNYHKNYDRIDKIKGILSDD
jgi:hypothetical protein